MIADGVLSAATESLSLVLQLLSRTYDSLDHSTSEIAFLCDGEQAKLVCMERAACFFVVAYEVITGILVSTWTILPGGLEEQPKM